MSPRRCYDCGSFLRTEPDQEISLGFGYDEDGPCYEGTIETRTCNNGHENEERA